MKRILLFRMNDHCYNATYCFVDSMARELENRGIEVVYFDGEKRNNEDLEKIVEEHFDAVLDFNSELPQLKTDDGAYYVDAFEAPFYNYIVDHPLYNHPKLKCKLKNYHVICLDENHAEYIRKYYPHIVDATVLPLGGLQATREIPYCDRTHEILFCGTYLNCNDYGDFIKQLPDDIQSDINDIIDTLKKDTGRTVESVAMELFGNNQEGFADRMMLMFLADIYIRAYFRDKVLRAIAQAGLPLTICGDKYTESDFSQFDNVKIMSSVSFQESIELMADAKIVLNVMPWFKAGAHDRIFSAMLNKAVCVTDSSSYIEEHFTHGEDIELYSLNHIEELPDRLANILKNADMAKTIADKGYINAASHHTFKERVEMMNWL